jgi:hypothetical protein
MADWWARRIGGGLEDVSVLDTAEDDLVTDTLTVFRGSLRQGEDADSAADLKVQEPDRIPSSEEGSLDYFAPAFHRVLGEDDSAPAASDAEAPPKDR